MNFGEVFSRAWAIVWKNKVLWLFGLLASLGASGGGGDSGGTGIEFNFQLPGGQSPLSALAVFLERFPAWLLALLLAASLIMIATLVILSTFGRAGLMRGAWLADGNETGLTANRLFAESRTYFWRVLLLVLLLWAMGLAVVFMLGLLTVLVSIPTFGLAALCLAPLWCLLVPLFFGAAVLLKLAIAAIVGENLGVIDSLRRAWAVFRIHPGQVIVMALALGILAFIANFLVSLPVALTVAPLVGFVLGGAGEWVRGGLVLSAILFVVYLPILLAARAVVQSYIDTAWTLIFRRLTQ